jgi:hypothetical protein
VDSPSYLLSLLLALLPELLVTEVPAPFPPELAFAPSPLLFPGAAELAELLSPWPFPELTLALSEVLSEFMDGDVPSAPFVCA